MGYPITISVIAGIAIRLWLHSSSAAEWIAERNEIVTPLTSWKRVTEGLSLYNAGISPYTGDIFHEMPLMLRVLNFLTRSLGSSMFFLFVITDVLIAIILERAANKHGRYLLKQQEFRIKEFASDCEKLLLKVTDLRNIRVLIVASYLFNPYTVVTCVAQSTAIFNNLAIVLVLFFSLQENRPLTSLSIAIGTYISLYPIMLVVPAAMYFNQCERLRGGRDSLSLYLIHTSVLTLSALGALLYLSFIMEGSWNFLGSTFGFILTVPDLTPNIGVFWYFFTEMFEHFRLFFICVFQINVFIYTVPFAFKLRDHPIFYMFVLISVSGIFKPYPSYADTALFISIMPLWNYTFQYFRSVFVVGVMLAFCSVLAPILWHLWIYSGSANANFYFAITLVLSTAQIFLISDMLFAFLKRENDLYNGTKPPMINGKPAQIVLE